jgi:hypothetical protein
MQFVRLHTKIGEKYEITSKDLEKIDEEIEHQLMLTISGKFSFKFQAQ